MDIRDSQEKPPKVVNQAGWAKFRDIANELGLNPDDPWIGGYVAYEWAHARYFFEAYAQGFRGRRVLEFGCNVGASGIVLGCLGAEVVGVDVDAKFAQLAQVQALAYGLDSRVNVLHLADTTRMPFDDGHFNIIVCNSVLEYVDPGLLVAVQKELLRLLAPNGLIFVLGTSNRLWPREVHSGKWLWNYVPRCLDRLFGGKPRQRGVSPFTVRRGFSGCALVDKEDDGATYLAARARMGTSAPVLEAMRIVGTILSPFAVTVGMLMPSFAMVLRRRAV